LRSGIPAELYELGLGSTLSINARAQDAEGAAAFIDYLVADKKRAAQWMAAVPSLFNAPCHSPNRTSPRAWMIG
jgi:hypothetical protein